MEIKDDDSSNDEPDNTPSVMVTQGELHALIEEEDKEEEALEEEMDEDTIRIVVEVIASLPHTPPDTVTLVESTSTREIASLTLTSFTQSSLSTSQLQVSTMEVSTTSSTEMTVSSSIKPAPRHTISISSVLASSTLVLSTTALSTLILSVASTVDIPVCTLPSIAPILSNISVLDSVSISIQFLYPNSFFTASPSLSTIVSIPKVKPVVETKKLLKLLLTGKEIEEDIDLDIEIEIPKLTSIQLPLKK